MTNVNQIKEEKRKERNWWTNITCVRKYSGQGATTGVSTTDHKLLELEMDFWRQSSEYHVKNERFREIINRNETIA